MNVPPLSHLADNAAKVFAERFGHEPSITVAAPGRVNIIGEHIDYNDGLVLPMAIDRHTVITAALNDRGEVDRARVYSAEQDETLVVPVHPGNKPKTEGWARYIEGVLSGYAQRRIHPPTFDAVVTTNIPIGGGLSSSAALEVAAATLTEALAGETIPEKERALLCQRAEQKFAGVPCGFMDQFSSVLGEDEALLLIDCKTQDVETIPFPGDEFTVLITNSNVSHELTSGGYASRRNQCESALPKLNCTSWRDVTLEHIGVLKDDEYKRARHVVTEIARTREAADAFRAGHWGRVGACMYASHESLRDDYEVSCSELDILVETLQQTDGVIGARMTGGGFGGCTVALVEREKTGAVTARLHEVYTAMTGITPTSFTSAPVRGARIIRPGAAE